MKSRRFPLLELLILLLGLGRAGGEEDGFGDVTSFFERHCFECHDAETKKGGLDLSEQALDFAGENRVSRWTEIHDRIAKGEMPPEKKPRPESAEIGRLLGWLRPRLIEADRRTREVVQRRLNREEYENTVRDLLAIETDLKSLLPADQEAAGFDNIGSALAISTEQMEAYLEAARLAIDAAIVQRERPEATTLRIHPKDEIPEKIANKEYALVDDMVVQFTHHKGNYSPVSTRKQRVKERGRYRIRMRAGTYRSEKPIILSVTASDFGGVTASFTNLGFFEVRPEARIIEFEAVLDERQAIQFFPHGLPHWIKDRVDGNHPGVGVGEVEITGPLVDAWPPESHRRLLGDVDLKAGTLEDARRILEDLARRAFRRPLEEGEIDRYEQLVRVRLEEGRGFEESLRVGLTAILCSPNFLYLREVEKADTDALSPHELASRLSYFLWSTMPDAELARLADEGLLLDSEVLAAQVDRLIDDPKAEAFVANFTGQWLDLRKIDETQPDEKFYPDFDELLKVSMLRESHEFFRRILRENRSVVDFLDADYAFLNGRLAEHYGVENVEGLELREVRLPGESVRGGVLTQGAVLKVTANGTTTSPVVRGHWVLENILGKPTPPPPPNTPGIEPDIRGATTIRQQLEKHRNLESCATCHRHIDPPGFALESFDPSGAYREKYLRYFPNEQFPDKDWGQVRPDQDVDASGSLDTGETFAGIREFKRLLLARKDPFTRCLAEKLATYALGREMGFSDREFLDHATANTAKAGYGLRTLVHEIVASEAFHRR